MSSSAPSAFRVLDDFRAHNLDLFVSGHGNLLLLCSISMIIGCINSSKSGNSIGKRECSGRIRRWGGCGLMGHYGGRGGPLRRYMLIVISYWSDNESGLQNDKPYKNRTAPTCKLTSLHCHHHQHTSPFRASSSRFPNLNHLRAVILISDYFYGSPNSASVQQIIKGTQLTGWRLLGHISAFCFHLKTN